MNDEHMRLRAGCLLLLAALAILFVLPFLWNALLPRYYAGRMFAPEDAPTNRVAIVFGAAVYGNGRLSPMLRDRVDTAIDLYEAGAVERLLFSGDNSSAYYNEPGQMMAYAVARGVPAAAIELDYAGRRTYDTCYRARHVFGVESAILVTQEFHLPRALFTCGGLGLDAIGVVADRRTYSPVSLAWSENREWLASLRALLDVIRQQPAAVVGPPLPLE